VPVLIGLSVFVPVEAKSPVHPEEIAAELPLAVQDVAVGDDHVMERLESACAEVDDKVNVGAGGIVTSGVTVNVTDDAAEGPPLLVQISVKVSVPTAVGVMVCVPVAASVPDQLPEAPQLVALDDQESVVDAPTAIEVEARLSAGAAGAVPEVANSTAELDAEVPEALAQVSV
jgi:hypothetical protein